MSTKKANKFVQEVLKSLNKSEKDLQLEKVEAFVEDAQISCSQQIATLETSIIPSLKLKLQREQKNLEKAKTAFETVRYSIFSDFDTYVSRRESSLDSIDAVKQRVGFIEQEIVDAEAQLKGFKDILIDLTA